MSKQHNNARKRHYRPYGTLGDDRLAIVPDKTDTQFLDPFVYARFANSGTTADSITFGPDGSTLRINSFGAVPFSYNGNQQPQGIFLEAPNQNRCGNSVNFATSKAASPLWSATNMTGAGTLNATGPDGDTSAVTLTASAANATIAQTLGPQSGVRVFSVWLRRVSGTGDIQIAYNAASTWTTVAVDSTWKRFKVIASSGTALPGIRIVTSGDVIEAFGPCMVTHAIPNNYNDPLSTVIGTSANVGHTGTTFYIGVGDNAADLNSVLAQLDAFTIDFKFRSAVREFGTSAADTIKQANIMVATEGYSLGDVLLVSQYAGNPSNLYTGETYFEDTINSIIDGPVGVPLVGPMADSFHITHAMGNNMAKACIAGDMTVDLVDPNFDYSPKTHGGELSVGVFAGGIYLEQVSLWPRVLSNAEIGSLHLT